MAINKHHLCASCPASKCSGAASHYALDRIGFLQTTKTKNQIPEDEMPGCPWYINAPEYGYCFWQFANELHNSPVPDKEICHLEQITLSQLKESFNNAVSKLKDAFDNGNVDVRELIELIKEKLINEPCEEPELMDEIKSEIDKMDTGLYSDDPEDAPKVEKKEKKKKKVDPMGLPLHRSGAKIDLYGIYSEKTLKKIKADVIKNGKHKPKQSKSSTKKTR